MPTSSGPITVEGTGVIPTEGLYDIVYNWDMKIMLGDVELIFRPGDERTRFIGDEGLDPGRPRSGRDTLASDPAILKSSWIPTANVLKVSTNHRTISSRQSRRGDPKTAVSNLNDAVRSDIISHLCGHRRPHEREDHVGPDPARADIAGSDKARRMLSRPMREPWTL